jgi:Flp pilus assembly protein TadB
MSEPEETVKLEVEVPKSQLEAAQKPAEPSDQSKLEETAQHTEEVEKSAEEKLKTLIKNVENVRREASQQAPISNPSKIIKPPSLPAAKDKTPASSTQKIVIAAGLIIALIGIILWPLINFATGIFVAIIGAVIVAAGTFIKL